MIRCYIADRHGVARHLPVVAGRIDWVQVRDKELPARELFEVVRRALEYIKSRGPTGDPDKGEARAPRVLVNSRLDVALAAGADGLHLPADSIAPSALRRLTPAGFLIGVSCHTEEEVLRAEREGADYVLLSPIFPSFSKPGYGPPLGLEALWAVCRKTNVPVLALGGVDERNAEACFAAGAAGFAAINAFEQVKI